MTKKIYIKKVLDKESIDKLFEENENQHDVHWGLYCLVFKDRIDPNRISKLETWPKASPDLSDYIWNKFMDFDKQYHPDVIAGGLWMNSGFDTFGNKHLKDFEVEYDGGFESRDKSWLSNKEVCEHLLRNPDNLNWYIKGNKVCCKECHAAGLLKETIFV